MTRAFEAAMLRNKILLHNELGALCWSHCTGRLSLIKILHKHLQWQWSQPAAAVAEQQQHISSSLVAKSSHSAAAADAAIAASSAAAVAKHQQQQ
jgi:hypothetical protein